MRPREAPDEQKRSAPSRRRARPPAGDRRRHAARLRRWDRRRPRDATLSERGRQRVDGHREILTGINESGVDNFLCYKVGATPGSPKFRPIAGVKIVDQFGSRMIDLRKIKKLCTPADTGFDPGAPTHANHLLCYAARLSEGEPKFVRTRVATRDFEFDESVLDVKSVKELCVPACKDEAAPCGSPSWSRRRVLRSYSWPSVGGRTGSKT